jgi:Arc/MetJ-type ribon-helix-helix transcriptional regulator
MNITLKPDIQKRIEERLRRGEFESAEAVVEQALTLFLDFEEEMSEAEFLDSRAAIDEALDQAKRGEGVTLEEFENDMRTKYGISR